MMVPAAICIIIALWFRCKQRASLPFWGVVLIGMAIFGYSEHTRIPHFFPSQDYPETHTARGSPPIWFYTPFSESMQLLQAELEQEKTSADHLFAQIQDLLISLADQKHKWQNSVEGTPEYLEGDDLPYPL